MQHHFRWALAAWIWVFCSGGVLFAAALDLSTLSKNLLRHSNFETPGDNHWGFGGSKFEESHFSTDAARGRYSLKWPYQNPYRDWPQSNPSTFLQYSDLYSDAILIEPSQLYTVSVFIKADVDSSPNSSVTLQILDADRNSAAILKDSLSGLPMSQQFLLTKEWKRYSLSVRMPSTPQNKCVLRLRFSGSPPWEIPYPVVPHHHGLVDAVQFEKGVLSDYQPAEDVDFGIVPQAFTNAFEWNQPVILHLYASNNKDEALSDYVYLHIEDYFGDSISVQALEIDVEAHKRVMIPVNLGSQLRGHFRAMIRKDHKVLTEKVFSTLPPPKNISPQDSIFGADGPLSDRMLELAKRLGIKWLRPHADLSWEFVETQKGVYSFPDYRVNLAKTYGISLFGWLYRTPNWANPTSSGMPGNLEDWRQFVTNIVAHYKDSIKYWEIYNEPAHAKVSGSEYLQIVTVARQAAKAADPDAKLMGWSDTGKSYSDVREELLAQLDLMSGHYYPTPTNLIGTALIDILRSHLRDVGGDRYALWNTEGGANSGPTFYRSKSDYDRFDYRWEGPRNITKYWVAHKYVGVKLFYYWLNFPSTDVDHFPAYSKSWTFNEYDSSLKASAVETAVAAHFLDGKNVVPEKIIYNGSTEDQHVTMIHFSEGPSRQILVAWVDSVERIINVSSSGLGSQVNIYDAFGKKLSSSGGGTEFSAALQNHPVFIDVIGASSEQINKSSLELGQLQHSKSIPINVRAEEVSQARTLNVEIFGSTNSSPSTFELIFQDTVSNPSSVFYSWDAPVRTADSSTLLLYHFDRRAHFGESDARVVDFSRYKRTGAALLGEGLSFSMATGKFAGALESDGRLWSSNNIRVPDEDLLSGRKQFTIEMWLKVNKYGARLLSKGDVNPTASVENVGFFSRIRESGGELIFSVFDGTRFSQRSTKTGFPLSDGLFHHVALVFDATAATQEDRRMDIYIDGQISNGLLSGNQCPTPDDGPSPGCPIADRINPLDIQSLFILGKTGTGPHTLFNGAIDELVITDRALSDGEVLSHVQLSNDKSYFWSAKISGQENKTDPVVLGTIGQDLLSGRAVRLSIKKSGNGRGVIASNTVGISCGGDCDEIVPPGYTLTLTATPQDGSGFAGWTGNQCRGQGPCVVRMDRDEEITANFTSMSGEIGRTHIGMFKNYFNPAKGETIEIPILVDRDMALKVDVVDRRGNVVNKLFDGLVSSDQLVIWDGRNELQSIISSGVYKIRIKINGQEESRKVVVVK